MEIGFQHHDGRSYVAAVKDGDVVRRTLGAAVVLLCVGLLSSCSLLPSHGGGFRDSSEQQAAAEMKLIADAASNHDAAALKKLFSPLAQQKAKDLDSELKYFLSAYPSGRLTWQTQGNGLEGSNELVRRATEVFGNYEASVGGKKFDLYFAYIPVNDFHADNIGLYALGVVPSTDSGYTATGDKKPFDLWASQFGIDDDTNIARGDPGVYVPQG